jgi:hypothetical protein
MSVFRVPESYQSFLIGLLVAPGISFTVPYSLTLTSLPAIMFNELLPPPLITAAHSSSLKVKFSVALPHSCRHPHHLLVVPYMTSCPIPMSHYHSLFIPRNRIELNSLEPFRAHAYRPGTHWNPSGSTSLIKYS